MGCVATGRATAITSERSIQPTCSSQGPVNFGQARYCLTPILAVRFRSSPRSASIYIPPYRRHALVPLSPSLSAPASHQGLSTGGDEMVQRLTYRKRHSYATKSNQTRVVKTPGPDPLLVLSFLPFSFHFWWSHRSASDVVLMCSIGLLFVLAGGKLVYQYTKKRASGPKCPVTGKKIQGVSGSFAQHTVGRSTACVIL